MTPEEKQEKDKQHWAYALAEELGALGIIQGRNTNPDGTPYFGLSEPVDFGTVLTLAAVMINYQENVTQVVAKLKKKRSKRGKK